MVRPITILLFFISLLTPLAALADVAPSPRPPRPPADGRAYDRATTWTELTLVLSDPSSAKHCPPEEYRWPHCVASPPKGYSNGYEKGTTLSYAYAPAGTYDVTLTVRATPPQKGPIVITRRGVRIEPQATVETFTSSELGPRPLRVHFAAASEVPEDREICAARGSFSMSCSSTQPQRLCSVQVGGKRYEARSCEERYVYWKLMDTLCTQKVQLRESEYAKLFTCEPSAAK